MPTVTLSKGPPQGYVVDPVTRTRWHLGQTHDIDDPNIAQRLASVASHGYAFEITDGAPPVAPATTPAAPADVAPVSPVQTVPTIPPAAPAASQ